MRTKWVLAVLCVAALSLGGRSRLATIQAPPVSADPAPWGGLRWCGVAKDGVVTQIPTAPPVIAGECLRVASIEVARQRRICYASYCAPGGGPCSTDPAQLPPSVVPTVFSGPLVEPARPGVCTKVWGEDGALVNQNEVH